jgi:hypothetical protein
MSNSWAMLKASATVLRLDTELLIFPLLSTLAVILITVSLVALIMFFGGPAALDGPGYLVYSGGFVFYLILYTVIFFFNAGLVGATLIRLDGGDPTVGDGMNIATKKLPTILGYAVIAATVGMVLRAIEERVGALGRIVVGLIGMSWALTTYLTVPVLVSKDVGAIDAVKESASIFRRTWGEQVVGNAGIGLATFMLFALMTAVGVPLVILVSSINEAFAIPMGITLGVGYFFLALLSVALQGIYSAALYRFATTGDAGEHFNAAMMDQAFRPK